MAKRIKAGNLLKTAKDPEQIKFSKPERDLILDSLEKFEKLAEHLVTVKGHNDSERRAVNLEGIRYVRNTFLQWFDHPREDGMFYAEPFGADWFVLLNALVLCGEDSETRRELLQRFW